VQFEGVVAGPGVTFRRAFRSEGEGLGGGWSGWGDGGDGGVEAVG